MHAAVEGSKRMADFAAKIVAQNGLDATRGGPISVLSGRIEDLDSLPVPQVKAPAPIPGFFWDLGYWSACSGQGVGTHPQRWQPCLA
jgi:hypothetical protein